MVEREASEDFDYLWDDPAESDGLTSGDEVPEVRPAEELESMPKDPGDDLWDEPDDNLWDRSHFDAFDDNTWRFTPAPPPWYRTKQALTAIVAASAALVAIVVSGVLLVVRGPANADGVTGSVTPTAPTTAGPVPMATSEQPPPAAPPPPTASQVNTAPTYYPTYQPRPTKAPEIGVTRTPVTREPLSVAPQPRTGQSGHH